MAATSAHRPLITALVAGGVVCAGLTGLTSTAATAQVAADSGKPKHSAPYKARVESPLSADRGDRAKVQLRVRSDAHRTRTVRLVVREQQGKKLRRSVDEVSLRPIGWRTLRVVHDVKFTAPQVTAVIANGSGDPAPWVVTKGARFVIADKKLKNKTTPKSSPSNSSPGKKKPDGANPKEKDSDGSVTDPVSPKEPGSSNPTSTPSPSPSPSAGDPTPGDGWNLHWSDEFSGTVLKTNNWQAYHNTYGDGNHEMACLTPSNIAVEDGFGTITSKKQTVSCPGGSTRQYTSGFLSSREVGNYFPLYGRYEIRAQIPHGQGLWPAFWLRHRLGAGVAEVDIMEYFHSQVPGKATQTLHFPTTIGRNLAKKSTFFESPVAGTGGWHTFSVDIIEVDGGAKVRFEFAIDGIVTQQYVNTNPSAWTGGDQQEAWDIAVNTAVGGDWAGHPEQQLGYLPNVNQCSLTWRAPPNGDPANCSTTGIHLAKLPAEYRIDYVRVYTK